MPAPHIATIESVRPICGADESQVATISGCTVIVQKDHPLPDNQIVYVEIDSPLPPADPQFAFIDVRGEQVMNEVCGRFLRTALRRGVYSQGMGISLVDFSCEGRKCRAMPMPPRPPAPGQTWTEAASQPPARRPK